MKIINLLVVLAALCLVACKNEGTTAEISTTEVSWVDINDLDSKVSKKPKKIVVDVYTPWCGPCKMIAPILDEIANEYDGKLKVAKLNIDENPATPPKFGIRGIPTLMLFKSGNVEATKVGAVSKSQLTAFIDSNM